MSLSFLVFILISCINRRLRNKMFTSLADFLEINQKNLLMGKENWSHPDFLLLEKDSRHKDVFSQTKMVFPANPSLSKPKALFTF